MSEKFRKKDFSFDLKISNEDIYAAMKEIPGYLDITSGDFKELYRLAYRHAMKRITQSIKASDIMTREVVTVERETPLKEVAKKMAEKVVSGIPVVDKNKKVTGVISEKDFLFRMGSNDSRTFMSVVAECLEGKGCVAVEIRAKKAEDLMTSPPITVAEDTTLQDISNLFKEKQINRVPVVDRDGYLIGIVAREDILEASILKES
ncbi:MAG: CBS domain-containing protein [Candidatus Hodarchaeales archaeon]|jgi:CBS-domain-containing membrane protein